MAYLPGKPNFGPDDEEQQQPTLSGGGGQPAPVTSGATAAPLSAPPPTGGQSQNQAPSQNANRSGRFTNLQDMLAQNKGIADQVKTAGASAIGSAKDSFNAAADPLRNASFTPQTDWRPAIESITGKTPVNNTATTVPTSGIGVTRMGGTNNLGGISSGGVGAPGALNVTNADPYAALRGMLTQSYNGPGPMSFDVTGATKKADALGNFRTAGAELAVGPYSAGASRLDAGLFGGSGEVRAVQNDLNKQVGEFRDSATKEMGDLNSKVASFEDAAARARDEVRTGLSGYGKELLAALQGRVDTANTQSQADFDSGVVRDASGRVVQFSPPPGVDPADIISDKNYYAPAGKMRGAWTGAAPGSATIGNMVTGDEFARFDALRQLLGDPTFDIQDTGDYTAGGYSLVDDPNYVAPEPELPGPMAKPELGEDGGLKKSDAAAAHAAWAARHPEAAAKSAEEREVERARRLARRNEIYG